MLKKAIVTAAFIAVGTTFAFAQTSGGAGTGAGSGGALKQGGAPPASALRRDDYLAPAKEPQVQSKQARKNYRTRSVRGSR
jgi:hypothetical protein